MKKKLKTAAVLLCVLLIAAAGAGFAVTPYTSEPPNEPVSGVKPFASSQGCMSNYYRIPSLITAADGGLVAATDARYGGTGDSPNDLETAVSLSSDSGATWSDSTLIAQFEDYVKNDRFLSTKLAKTNKNSASYIDPSMLVDNATGRIYMLVDAFPYSSGAAYSEKGSGYVDVNGERCLMLKKDGESSYDYTLRSDGFIYDKNSQKTEYSVKNNIIYQNGEELTVNQKKVGYWYTVAFDIKTDKLVPMNIMYKDSLFHPQLTSYLYLMYSDDNGKSWSQGIDLNASVKPDDAGFMGVCPGRGLCISAGEYSGRLLFPVYFLDSETGLQKFAVIYSDDSGASWKLSDCVPQTEDINNMSETQIVEFPNGALAAYSRTTHSFVSYSYSINGGSTWSEPALLADIPLTSGSGCQISAINYSAKIDGCSAVLLSAPAGDGRTNGFIYIGLMVPSEASKCGYEVQWKYKKEITDKNTNFAYSCLTELENGDIGILYERSNQAQAVDTLVFETYSLSEITG